jgi:hypothetical protein
MPAPFPRPEEFRDRFREMMPDRPDLNEPGFAATFDYNAAKEKLWNYGPLVGLGGLGAALWYLNREQKPKAPVAKKKPQPVVGVEKSADLKDIIDNIRWHLPKLRVPDTVVGGLAGAGAGGLYDLIRGKGKDGKRKTLRRVLTGALTGAGLTNLVGDRFRRYISNTKLPLGYTPNAANEITPSWKRIWNAAILDKPDYDPKAVDYWNSRRDGMMRFLPARQEIVRRQFGLPFDQKDPWWQKNPEGYYSLNENSSDYLKRMSLLFGSHVHKGIARENFLHAGPDKLLKNPETALAAFTKYPDRQSPDYDFFGSGQLLGGMHLPYVKNPDGSFSGMALDRWDVTPNKAESDYFKSNLGKLLTDPKWRMQPLQENLSWYVKPEARHTNSSAMKAIGGRWIWDNILSDELPWIGQKFTVAPRTDRATLGETLSGTNHPNTLQFLKFDNSPATPAMGYAALDAWDKNR